MSRDRVLLVLLLIAALAALTRAQVVAGAARNLGLPINTPGIEVGPNLSADGLTIYFVSDRPGGHSGAPELWTSSRPTPQEAWRSPINLGSIVNSHSAASPSISADELELYFDTGTQVRPGGQGSGDIWVTRRSRVSDPWSAPENMGPGVNSPSADSVPKLGRDGLTLYFASNRPGGSGNLDIWVATRRSRSEPWEAPVNLGQVVNGPGNDWSPAISASGLTLIIQSDRPGGLGGDDLWLATRDSHTSTWGMPVHLGPDINSTSDDAKADISSDGRSLLFMSTRPGGIGSLDIWEARVEIR